MYKDNSQLRIEDFVFPYGKLDPENDWVRLAALVPWDVAEERYAARFVNNGHPAVILEATVPKREAEEKDDSDDGNDSPNSGTLILDATCCPADIACPQDINLLNQAREKQRKPWTNCVKWRGRRNLGCTASVPGRTISVCPKAKKQWGQ